jgi:hypothetical protein
MSPAYRRLGAGAVKSRSIRSGHLLVRRLGHGGADLAAQVHADDAEDAHHPLDALVVHPAARIAQFGGDPRRPVRAVLAGVDPPDLLRQRLTGTTPLVPGATGAAPPVVARPRHLKERHNRLMLNSVRWSSTN